MKERKFSKKKIFYESIDSTNGEMHRMLQKKDLDEGTVIFAGFQTSGKGHMGNIWESEPGKNLLMSILFIPDFLEPRYQFYLSMIASLALLEIIGSYCKETTIKWPNDILVRDKKISGLLIENEIQGNIIEKSIAGIGLNVNQEKFSSNIPDPTSLYLETGCHFDMTKLLNSIMKQIEVWYKVLLRDEREMIRRKYMDNLYGFGEIREYNNRGEIFKASIKGIESTGELVLESEEKEIRKFGFKEVEMIK
jgi:BirA family biotin operon repressor/biotin-[acetyl-CoA-carboxylase] ligase